jgi:pimeloyl-ACP methyl ester carboxylesterase
MDMARAEDWRNRGGYFSWRPAARDAAPVEIFHVELGDPGAPVLLLIHGWPTSSIDWFSVAGPLSARFRVCALDFPGYGFSDKPQGWGYSLARDEELIEFYLSEVLGAEAGVIVAHDRGDSVALPRHPDLGPVRHGFAAAGGELRVEPVPHAQARRQ